MTFLLIYQIIVKSIVTPLFFLSLQVNAIHAFDKTDTPDAKTSKWSNRIYSRGVEEPQIGDSAPSPRTQDAALKRNKLPNNTPAKMAAATAAPSQNRLSVDSWYYSLTESGLPGEAPNEHPAANVGRRSVSLQSRVYSPRIFPSSR
jgi:hypothetical protein